jgi:ABC-type branched-subunit amino acid transport system ATPase component
MLLEVRGVARHFGGVRAVDGVSFALARGEFAALIGPNGAGKSTLFALIAGQLAATRGEMLFEGRRLADRPDQQALAGIGRTFQTAATFASMTVRENVLLAQCAQARRIWRAWQPLWRQSAERIAQAEALLAQVGLATQAARAAADLAYADLKRLELAVALAGRPRLLLMDEPTAGMAASERTALMDLVQDIARREDLTVLFTEHSMEVVFGYARRVLVLSRGQLIADGGPEQVRADPAAQAAYFGEAA